MSDFLFLLGFSAIPLMTALAYAAMTPAMGAALYLRGEILLGIVLPPFGSAVIGLCLLGGLSAENRLLLSVIVAASLFAFLSAPVFRNAQANGSDRKKEMALAAVFVLGQTVTYLSMHFSTHVHADLSHLLSGEILAVGPVQFWTALAMNAALLGLCYRFRGVVFEYCLDETGLRLRHRSHRRIETGYRIGASVVITSALVCVGPLLTTAWLILPPLFAMGAASGVEPFFLMGIAIGIAATLIGFVCALALDFPPVYIISAAHFLLGAGILALAKTKAGGSLLTRF